MNNDELQAQASQAPWFPTSCFDGWRRASGRRVALVLTLSAVVLVLAVGCGSQKQKTVAQTAQILEQTFKTAEPQTQQAVTVATTAIKAAAAATDVNVQRVNYIQALRPATAVASQGRLSPEQIKALHQVYVQVQRAAAENPKLDSQELYNARAALAIQLRRAGVLP
jgi:hypothetical protein